MRDSPNQRRPPTDRGFAGSLLEGLYTKALRSVLLRELDAAERAIDNARETANELDSRNADVDIDTIAVAKKPRARATPQPSREPIRHAKRRLRES